MPTSVGILTATFSSPLPYPGHLFLRPHHLLKPSTLFYGNLLKPLTLSKLLPQPSHFYRNPKVCWRLFPHLTSSPTLEEGGKGSSSWLPANSVSILRHRLSHFSLENPMSCDDTLFILQRCHGLLLNSLLLSCLGMPPWFSVLASTSSLASTRVTRASTFMPH